MFIKKKRQGGRSLSQHVSCVRSAHRHCEHFKYIRYATRRPQNCLPTLHPKKPKYDETNAPLCFPLDVLVTSVVSLLSDFSKKWSPASGKFLLVPPKNWSCQKVFFFAPDCTTLISRLKKCPWGNAPGTPYQGAFGACHPSFHTVTGWLVRFKIHRTVVRIQSGAQEKIVSFSESKILCWLGVGVPNPLVYTFNAQSSVMVISGKIWIDRWFLTPSQLWRSYQGDLKIWSKWGTKQVDSDNDISRIFTNQLHFMISVQTVRSRQHLGNFKLLQQFIANTCNGKDNNNNNN